MVTNYYWLLSHYKIHLFLSILFSICIKTKDEYLKTNFEFLKDEIAKKNLLRIEMQISPSEEVFYDFRLNVVQKEE